MIITERDLIFNGARKRKQKAQWKIKRKRTRKAKQINVLVYYLQKL